MQSLLAVHLNFFFSLGYTCTRMNSNAMQYNSGRKKKEAKQKLSKTSSNTNTNTKQVL